jgi:hypothetical protein
MFRISVVCTKHPAVEFQLILSWQDGDALHLFPSVCHDFACSCRTAIVYKDRDPYNPIA